MSSGTDWIPNRRDDILNLGEVWMTVMAKNAAAWGIPTEEISEMADLISTAEAILATSKGADRTPTVTAKCKAAFIALEKKLRYLKERYVHKPPLTDADYPSLLLAAPDAVKSPVPPPTGFAEACQKALGFLAWSLRGTANSIYECVEFC